MHYIRFSLRCGVSLLPATLAITCALAGGTPKIQLTQTEYDFGTTSKVQKVEGTIAYQNLGDGVLRVTGIKSTCACTQASLEPDELNPGDAGAVIFSIRPGPSVGDIREQIQIFSNDPHNSPVTLSLRLRIPLVFEVTPPAVQLGYVKPGSKTNLTFQVRRADGQKLRITKVVSDDPLLTTRLVPVRDSQGGGMNIVARLKAADKPGMFHDTLQVHTGEEYTEGIPKPSFEISIKGVVGEPPR
jgi:hypothetical protein